MKSHRQLAETALLAVGFWLALSIPVIYGLGGLAWRIELALLALALITVAVGRGMARWFGVDEGRGFGAAFAVVIGYASVSLLHLTLTAAFNLSVKPSVLAELSAILAFLWWHGKHSQAAEPSARSEPDSLGAHRLDWLALILAALLVTLWGSETLVAVQRAGLTGEFRAWEDYFLHAAEISYLRDYPAFHGQTLYLADTPQAPYHRASFALAAVFSWLAGISSLLTATVFWLPAGMLLLGVAAYGFGCCLGGRSVGLACLLALFLLPDAPMYAVPDGFFSFHWLLQVTPGTGYAVAIVLLAFGLYLKQGAQPSLRGWLLLAALLGLSAMFRIHLAILAGLSFALLFFTVSWQPANAWHRWAAIISFSTTVLGVSWLLEHLRPPPPNPTGLWQTVLFFEFAHLQTPNLYQVWLTWLNQFQPFSFKLWSLSIILVGYGLMVLAFLGALLPALGIACAFGSCWSIPKPERLLPLALVLAYAVMIVVMPIPSNGDISEYGHRPFPLVYAVTLLLLVVWAAAWWRRSALRRLMTDRVKLLVLSVACLCGIATAWHFSHGLLTARVAWAKDFALVPLPPDLMKAGDYIRTHSRPTDRVLSSDDDPVAAVAGLTERQAFLSRSLRGLFQKLGGVYADRYAAHAKAHRELGATKDFQELLDFGRKHQIRWYLLKVQDQPGWPAEWRDFGVFHSGDFTVFDLSSPLR